MPRRQQEWKRLTQDLTGELAQAMAFLRDHLPPSDLDCYPAELFLRFARHALWLREAAPWCQELDWEVFAHYVLFPRVNDEDLSFHREIFSDALLPWVRGLPSMEARILSINRWCCEHASYQAQDARTASPLTVYRCGSGRCGELSAFLASALRSVGIPARQVYAPRWSHCDDNHAWVEALCGGQWRFLGACEPEPVLDRGWFNTAASRAVLVHSRVFGAPGSAAPHGEPLGVENGVAWFNQTPRYADTTRYTFRALLEDGRPAAGAEFHLQILNESSFHTIAVLTADETGTAQAALGRGSIHVCALLDGLCAEGDCGRTGITLQLAPPPAGDRPWTDFDFHAPECCRADPALDGEQKALRAHARRQGADLRERRRLSYSAPPPAREEARRAGGRGGGGDSREDLRAAARGNWKELQAFLEDHAPWQHEAPERLVRTLSDKDLRDVTRQTLEDHFNNLPPRRPGVPEDIYWQYTACPRVALEPLKPWRRALRRALRNSGGPPDQEPFSLLPTYGNLYWTPAEALESRRLDEKSFRVWFAAGLRVQGWPTRLRPLDGLPEVWEDGGFHPVFPIKSGTLTLTTPDAAPLRADQDWSLSRWEPEGWRLLHPGDGWREGRLSLTLPVGRYRIITTVRLPAGDQLARRCEFALAEGEERALSLTRRPWSAEDLLSAQPLPALAAKALDGAETPDLFRQSGPALALWAEEGGEPTEHVLNELMERAEEVNALPLRLFFLVRNRSSLAQPTLAAALNKLDRASVWLGDWAYDLERVARCLGRDPDLPPLAVLCDGAGTCRYSASGYRAGGVELLLRAASAALRQ